MIMEVEKGSTRLHLVVNSIWKRLRSCLGTDHVTNFKTAG